MKLTPRRLTFDQLPEDEKRRLQPRNISQEQRFASYEANARRLVEEHKRVETALQRVEQLLQDAPEVVAFKQFLDTLPLLERNTLLKRLEVHQ